MGDMLKERGYATACFGKWHLGDEERFLPTNRGFDEYFGIPYSNDMAIDPDMPLADDVKWRKGATAEDFRGGEKQGGWVPLFRNEEVIEYPANQSTLTKRYTREAVRFIRENRDNPFFLYVPHTMPHVPLYASEEFRGKTERGLYGDIMEELDWSTGRILETIQELGKDRETLVIFTSDNGPWLSKGEAGGSQGPLRNGKGTTYEGGVRVPCLMRWPGVIPPGHVCTEPCGTIDMLPTFAAITGAQLPTDRIIDGENILPLMTGERAKSPHDSYYYYSGNSQIHAVRQGDWKFREVEKPELYNLREDISEQNNLAEVHPEKVKQMRQDMRDFDRELKKNRRSPGKI